MGHGREPGRAQFNSSIMMSYTPPDDPNAYINYGILIYGTARLHAYEYEYIILWPKQTFQMLHVVCTTRINIV